MSRRFLTIPSGRVAKWVILGFWLVLVIGMGGMAQKLTDVQENDSAAWLPESAESTEVFEHTQKVRGDTMPALVVYERPSGVTQPDKDKATADAQRFAKVKNVTKVDGPISDKDNQALLVTVTIKLGEKGWFDLIDRVDEMRKIGESAPDGLKVEVTGPGGYGADAGKIFESAEGQLLLITLAVVIVILLITYRSPILWILPILTAVVGLTVSQAIIYLLAKHADLTVNGQSTFILAVLVIGAGTDYALLLVARYREELRKHEDRHEAMAIALRRCGGAIIASAATVALGLLCLFAAELTSTKGLGPVCAIGILVGLFAMMTLLPALLVILGRWIFWPKRPVYGTPDPIEKGLWAKVGQGIGGRPRTTWVVTAGVLAFFAAGMFTLKASGIEQVDQYWTNPEAVKGDKTMAKHFPAGSGEPIEVIGKPEQAAQLRTALSSIQGLTVSEPQTQAGKTYLEGTMPYASTSDKAYDTVEQARAAIHKVDGADGKVGGSSAIYLDIADANEHDRNLIIPLVLGVVFVILMLLLRAIIAPLVLIATVVLSFGATMGVSAFVFNNVFNFAGADQSFPLWAFVFLVALGIDYNIFLMSRVREETKKHGHRRGSIIGLTATGGVITSAGLVLAGTFSALAVMPMVFVTQLGFAVAFGVLLDTIIVRSVLVTALNLDIGKKIWWPSSLAKKEESEPPAGEAEHEAALTR